VDDFIAPIDDVALSRDEDIFVSERKIRFGSPALFAKPKNFRLMAEEAAGQRALRVGSAGG